MPQGLYIDARQLAKGAKAFEQLTKLLPDKVSDVLNANAIEIERMAKDRAPHDRGAAGLSGRISANLDKPLQKHITAGVPYAAYMEFGTGRYAAQYVSSLPAEYQKFAAQFKRGKVKNIKTVLVILMEWFGRVGIKDKSKQYFIAKNIFINGVHPHPFMIPSLRDQQPQLIKDFKALLNSLKL